jgi:hypothetical protein
MAVQGAFCGNCGSPLVPGATFCGRCGAPVGFVRAQAAVAPPPPAYPPQYPAYAYPRAQPAQGRLVRSHTTQIAVAMGLVFLLVLGAALVSVAALLNNTGSRTPCTQNCGPKIGTALPSSATYTSSTYGYEVDYDSGWTVQNKTGSELDLSTDAGGAAVIGQKAGPPLDQVIDNFVSNLPSATYQDVKPVMDVKGAHMGDQNGAGVIYAANYIASNGSAVKVRFAVIAATKNGVTVVLFALNEADTKDFASGIPEGQKFDYMCTEFRWG